ncbi:MAG: hypothetical protein DRG20_05015 [Deltaproteobacteria bacterium]|nr:sulfite exporter TauE/SafE family protein [Deltaproteobacteria bacterium]RLA89194.1 MAG: hypothetical protein DRG20_05015 [Deltaproteobacteria bacterium]
MDTLNLIIIFFIGLISSIYGTLVGGGSLITIPTLIFVGLPLHIAIGTNRLGAIGANISGLYKFHKKRLIDYKIGLMMGVPVLFGSILGANLVLEINEEILKKVIGVVTFIILLIITFKPKMGLEERKRIYKRYEYIIGISLSFFLGIYGGFYGAGTGTFFSYLLILLFGETFLKSAGTRKIATLLLSIVATLIFAFHGVILYYVAIVLFTGRFIGSYIGAHYSDKIGNLWLKRLFFLTVLIMAIKLIY